MMLLYPIRLEITVSIHWSLQFHTYLSQTKPTVGSLSQSSTYTMWSDRLVVTELHYIKDIPHYIKGVTELQIKIK